MTILNNTLGPFKLNHVTQGDTMKLVSNLPDNSIDILITSPPYWGQRITSGMGNESDPREYLDTLINFFIKFLPKLKENGLVWINIGDAYNTPVNWRHIDYNYSTLGKDKNGFSADNSAYVKPRAKRKAYTDKSVPWLSYGNLLALPQRLLIALCDAGYVFRGEVIWNKKNPMPEGRCRRPHRQHEPIYLLVKSERKHHFLTKPPVRSVWTFGFDNAKQVKHYSTFPIELPLRCIRAYGKSGPEVIVFDPFSGSGTTGIAALNEGCSYIGFEIDSQHVEDSNKWLKEEAEKPKQLKITND